MHSHVLILTWMLGIRTQGLTLARVNVLTHGTISLVPELSFVYKKDSQTRAVAQ